MVLQNHVMLQSDIPATIHIVGIEIIPRTITDARTGRPVPRNTMEMTVDELNGQPVQAILSTMADGLAGQIDPYRRDGSYSKYNFTILQRGEGFLRRWTVTRTPRP